MEPLCPKISTEIKLEDNSCNEILKKEDEIKSLLQKVCFLRKEIKLLSQKATRNDAIQKRKSEEISSLKDEIKSMKKKKNDQCNAGTQTDIQQATNSELLDFFQDLHRHSIFAGAYTQKIRQFAAEINYLSPKAYRALRAWLQNSIPNQKQIYRWVQHVNTKPGFFQASLQYIKDTSQTPKPKLYNLIIDEVHLRKKITFDGKSWHGYIDHGPFGEVKNQNKEARAALFIMATEINGSKAIPIGYILTNGIDADVTATVLRESIIKLHENGAKVIGVTFDGLPSNFTAAEKLGANLKIDDDNFASFFSHPTTGDPVFVLLDPSHMIKLLRNMWKNVEFYMDSQNNVCTSIIE